MFQIIFYHPNLFILFPNCQPFFIQYYSSIYTKQIYLDLNLILQQNQMQEQDKYQSRRFIPSQENHTRNLDHNIKSLQDEIQLTIYNYENILQTQKKNSSDRSQFLLYLIQSLRTRHLQQLQSLSIQVQSAEGQRQSMQAMQKQMQNIGQGVDQIMEESKKLKIENQILNKELQDQFQKQKEIDEQIEHYEKQIQEYRLKIDDWQRSKIKWNRHKKQLIQMIQDAQKQATRIQNDKSQYEDGEQENSICNETGQNIKLCEHCQMIKINQLKMKYPNPNNNNNFHNIIHINGTNEFRKST